MASQTPADDLIRANGGDDDDDSTAATYAGAKRRIASLEDQLSSIKESVTKRKSYVVDSLR